MSGTSGIGGWPHREPLQQPEGSMSRKALWKALFPVLIAIVLPSAAIAKDIVPNTIDCAAFAKQSDGSWQVDGTTTFDAGAATQLTLSNKAVSRRAIDVGGADLYAVIEAKCGAEKH
jgi:hypothetical protein